VGKIGEGAFNVAFAIVIVGLLFGLFTTPVLAGIAIFCAVAVLAISALTKK